MLDQLTANFFLLSTLKMNSPQSGLENLTAELRVRGSGDGSNLLTGEILSIRVVHTLGWNPDHPLYFEATQGSMSLTDIDTQTARLEGKVSGFYRPTVREPSQFRRDGDFLEAPTVPATLDLSLLLSLPAPNVVVPQVVGSFRIDASELSSGEAQYIDGTVAGEARLFPHDLPARDFSGQAFVYFLEVLPVLVQEKDRSTTFQSTGRLLGGAVDVWQKQCGIQIIQEAPFPLIVNHNVIESLEDGNTSLLREIIHREVPRGDGVPVAFVHPLFAQGGGEASDHGPQRAIVIVTEQSGRNRTLLAHELGHVLGGKETGSPQTATYWVGGQGTVMHASGDVMVAAPSVVDAFTCEHARRFALWKKVL